MQGQHKPQIPIRTVQRGESTPTDPIEAVVLLVDRSPSMETTDYLPTRLDAAKQAVLAFYNAKFGVDPRDRIAVLAFDRDCHIVGAFGQPVSEVWQRVQELRPGDSTALGRAIERGFDYVLQHAPSGYARRIVILSDGDTNSGPDPHGFTDRCRQAHVIIDTVGIGSNKSDDYRRGVQHLEALSKATGGLFAYCSDVPRLVGHYRDLAQKKSRAGIVTIERR